MKRYALGALGLLTLICGCGVREPNTGSLYGRVMNYKGDIVDKATVYSLFNENEKVISDKEGKFFLPNLPAGNNKILVIHPSYRQGETSIEIPSHQTVTIESIKLDLASEPQLISNSSVIGVTSSTATISWKTFKPVRCKIEYGVNLGYGTFLDELQESAEHRFTISNLNPDTVYHARVGFFDDSANFRFSYDIPFRTSPPDAPLPPVSIQPSLGSNYGIINVAWGPSSTTSVVGYLVNRRESGGTWQQLNDESMERTVRIFEDKTVRGGHFYEYSVAAVDSNGASTTSEVSAKIFMPGVIGESLRITASDSPIVLFSDLIVGPGVALYVEKGVEFRIAASDSFRLGKDADRVEILIQGFTQMAGTASEPIRFVPYNGMGTRDFWAGFLFENGESGKSELSWLEISGCKNNAITVENISITMNDLAISYSEGGISLKGISTVPVIKNCILEDISSSAFLIQDTRWFQISNSTIRGAGVGFQLFEDRYQNRMGIDNCWIDARDAGIIGTLKNSIIKNCVIVAKTGTGINYIDATEEKNYIDHCTIDAQNGIRIASGLVNIENNIIFNFDEKGKTGIDNLAAGVPGYAYNDIFGFLTPYKRSSAGEGALAAKPEFSTFINLEYKLISTSVLKTSDRYHGEMGRYGKTHL